MGEQLPALTAIRRREEALWTNFGKRPAQVPEAEDGPLTEGGLLLDGRQGRGWKRKAVCEVDLHQRRQFSGQFRLRSLQSRSSERCRIIDFCIELRKFPSQKIGPWYFCFCNPIQKVITRDREVNFDPVGGATVLAGWLPAALSRLLSGDLH